ncbi:MAG: hypothetical protein JO027_07590 [Solirubrobacterales bacterium]|nr:hypothetical protein [Solirubrobacterales bacterium]
MVEAILGVVIGAAAYEAVRRGWSAAPTLRGWVKVSELRAVFAGCFFFFATLAVGLSYTGHHHEDTYALWYGLAGAALVGVLATTIVVGRGRSATSGRNTAHPAPPPQLDLVSAEHRNEIRDIFMRCHAVVGLGLAYTWGDELRRSIALAHYPDLVREVEKWSDVASGPRAARDALRARFRRDLDALLLEAPFNVPAIEEGFVAYTEARALQGQLLTALERERLWAIYRPAQGPPDGAHIRGFHDIAIQLDNHFQEPAYTTIAVGLINRVMPVFNAAQNWPEARAIPEARDTKETYDTKPVLRELERVVARDRIAVTPECPVCGEIG